MATIGNIQIPWRKTIPTDFYSIFSGANPCASLIDSVPGTLSPAFQMCNWSGNVTSSSLEAMSVHLIRVPKSHVKVNCEMTAKDWGLAEKHCHLKIRVKPRGTSERVSPSDSAALLSKCFTQKHQVKIYTCFYLLTCVWMDGWLHWHWHYTCKVGKKKKKKQTDILTMTVNVSLYVYRR